MQVAQQLLVQQAKGLDTNRLAGFVKELGCAALELETGDALGSLALMNRLLRCALQGSVGKLLMAHFASKSALVRNLLDEADTFPAACNLVQGGRL